MVRSEEPLYSKPPANEFPELSTDVPEGSGAGPGPVPTMSAMTTSPKITTISRARARALQMPLKELLGPDHIKLHHDTYVRKRVITTTTRAAALISRLPAASHLSHHTAVTIWGGVAPPTSDLHVSMATRESRCRRAGVAAHLSPSNVAITNKDGLPISTPVQAFLDLASAGVSLVDLVVAGDSLVKALNLEPEDFIEAAETWTGRNVRRARRAAALIRADVDSPMETKLRLLLIFAGFAEPEVNFILRNEHGVWVWRFDLYYDRWKLIIEYDGRQHAFDVEQWSRDLSRREALDRDGLRILVIQSDGIYGDPLHTLQRVRDALLDRGATDVPRAFKGEWMKHFSSRTRVA